MNSKKQINVNDKVFAKLPDSPAWPAIVSHIIEITPSQVRYHVFLFGTGKRAICKAEDLWEYEQYKSVLGTPKPHPFFSEAIREIEHDTAYFICPFKESEIRAKVLNAIAKDDDSFEEEVPEMIELADTNSVTEEVLTIDEGMLISSNEQNVVSNETTRKIDLESGATLNNYIPECSTSFEWKEPQILAPEENILKTMRKHQVSTG